MTKAKKITKIVVSSITGFIMVIVLYMLICNVYAIRNEKPVRLFGYSYSYVPTESMEPTIKAGDSIIFKDVSYDSCSVGDIIIYKSQTGETEGLFILHRIVGITAEGFIVKGDNNSSVDSEIVTESMLIGRYVKTFNFLNVGKLAQNKSVIYTLLIMFFFGIMIMEGVNIYLIRYRKSKKNAIKPSEEELKAEILAEMKEELLKELQEDKKDEEDK